MDVRNKSQLAPLFAIKYLRGALNVRQPKIRQLIRAQKTIVIIHSILSLILNTHPLLGARITKWHEEKAVSSRPM